MKKLEIEKTQKLRDIQISFHDYLTWMEISNYISKNNKKILNYILLINIYFVFKYLSVVYKQTINTLWKDFLNNAFKYWLLIYLLPLFGLGIVLPSALVDVIYINFFNLWLSWIIISALFILFVSPYSLLLTFLIYSNYINKIFNNQFIALSKK